MPLPSISKYGAKQCIAKCKATQQKCVRPADFFCTTCRIHGARRPESIKRGKDHPNYRHGEATLEAKAERSAASIEMRKLEAMMYILGMTDAPRWRGRKPKSD